MRVAFNEPTKAKLIDVNPRSEKHGPDELVPAIDLRLQVETSNQVLSQLDPELLSWLYKKSEQLALDGLGDDSGNEYSALRFEELGQPLKWGGEGTGYSLAIDLGISEDAFIRLSGCKVHKLHLVAKAGGTSQLTFTVSCAEGVTELACGKAGTRVQHDVWFTLVPPEAVS